MKDTYYMLKNRAPEPFRKIRIKPTLAVNEKGEVFVTMSPGEYRFPMRPLKDCVNDFLRYTANPDDKIITIQAAQGLAISLKKEAERIRNWCRKQSQKCHKNGGVK